MMYNSYEFSPINRPPAQTCFSGNKVLFQVMEVVHLYKSLLEKSKDAELLCSELDEGLEVLNSIC